MVDNRGVSPITTYFKAGDASGMANKMSEEKYGQGGEYFMTEMEEEQRPQEEFQDRSAQLRASLNGLAAQNAGSIRFMKTIQEKEKENKDKKRRRFEEFEEELFEELFED
ncbi:hypothetical protein IJ531_04370 [bacterium]|nr:hypothetical protein [bacterium]